MNRGTSSPFGKFHDWIIYLLIRKVFHIFDIFYDFQLAAAASWVNLVESESTWNIFRFIIFLCCRRLANTNMYFEIEKKFHWKIYVFSLLESRSRINMKCIFVVRQCFQYVPVSWLLLKAAAWSSQHCRLKNTQKTNFLVTGVNGKHREKGSEKYLLINKSSWGILQLELLCFFNFSSAEFIPLETL